MLYSAPYIVPVTSPIIINSAILVKNGSIVDIGSQKKLSALYPQEESIHFPQAAILPGLVNPHIHLDLSALEGKIPSKTNFTDWITHIIRYRIGWNPQIEAFSIRAGIKESLKYGTTCVGDISKSGMSAGLLAEYGMCGVVFLEVLGFNSYFDLCGFKQNLAEFDSYTDINLSISPHAPYSASPQIYKDAMKIADVLPVCTHLAETAQELEFTLTGGGMFRKLLEGFNSWNPDWRIPEVSPIKYLSNLGVLKENMTAVHLNCLDTDDISILSESKVCAVSCQGSNLYFGRDNPYLGKLYNAGVEISLATDSLASNQQLNMFREMRLFHEAYPEIPADKILQMAAINGARALGLDRLCGSIEKGKRADFVVIQIPDKTMSPDKLTEHIISSEPVIIKTILKGKIQVCLKDN